MKLLQMNKLKFLINKGLKLFSENFAVNLTSIITVATALYIFFIFFTLSYSSDVFFGNLSNVQNIRVYLKSGEKAKVDNFINAIKRLKSVKSVKYYSSKDSYNHLKGSNINSKYLELVPYDFFPEFIEIALKDEFRDIKFAQELEHNIAGFDIVEVSSYGEKWLLDFLSIKYGLKLFFWIITTLLAISIGSVIFNTIKLNLYRYRDAIRLYSLVGATRSFIVVPYLVSSFLEATAAFVISFGFNFITFWFVNMFFLKKLSINFIVQPDTITVLTIFFIFMAVSIYSSFLSMTFFLKRVGSIND